MAMKSSQHTWVRLLVCLLLLLPVVLLFLLPAGGFVAGGHWFWMLLVLSFWLMLLSLGVPEEAEVSPVAPATKRMLYPEEQPAAVREVMDVEVATAEPGFQVFRGRLREAADSAYHKLKSALPGAAAPLLQEDNAGGTVIFLPQARSLELESEPSVRLWVHWLLLLATIVTTTAAGAAYQGVNLWREPERFAAGLPYSLGLMAILGVHELGHYFTAKRYGIRVTPPYFIPVPFALGTFGAFIQMRSTPENRKALFDVAIAGPLAGLVIAVPALLVGLRSSTVVPGDAAAVGWIHGTSVGSSVLFALLAKLSLGQSLAAGHVLQLSPLAFAGWLGLFITALNLVPVGQLDGGHIVQALFGGRIAGTIGSMAMWSLLLLALFVWPGLMMWAILVFFIAGRVAPPLNDLTPLTPGRQWLGYAALVILALILVPLPHSLWSQMGIHCPYA